MTNMKRCHGCNAENDLALQHCSKCGSANFALPPGDLADASRSALEFTQFGNGVQEAVPSKSSFARKYFYVLIPIALIAVGLLLNIQGGTTKSNGYWDVGSTSCFDPVTGSFESPENFNVYGTGRFDGNSQSGTFNGRTYEQCLLDMAVADSKVASGAAQEQRGFAIARFGAIGTVVAIGVAFYRRKTDS